MEGYHQSGENYLPVMTTQAVVEPNEIEENRRTSPNEFIMVASLCGLTFAGIQSASYLFYFFPRTMAVPSILVIAGAIVFPVMGFVTAHNARRKFRTCLLIASAAGGVIAGNASFVTRATQGYEVEALLLGAIAIVGAMAIALRIREGRNG